MTKKKPNSSVTEKEVNRLIEERKIQVQALKKILKELKSNTIK